MSEEKYAVKGEYREVDLNRQRKKEITRVGFSAKIFFDPDTGQMLGEGQEKKNGRKLNFILTGFSCCPPFPLARRICFLLKKYQDSERIYCYWFYRDGKNLDAFLEIEGIWKGQWLTRQSEVPDAEATILKVIAGFITIGEVENGISTGGDNYVLNLLRDKMNQYALTEHQGSHTATMILERVNE